MNDCVVSVIVPAYNAETTIVPALRSVVDQTVLQTANKHLGEEDIEVLVVDDASRDKTTTLAVSWLVESGLTYKLLRCPDNRGPAAARNRAIAEARGEWLAFLDADDLWLPWRLELQFSVLESSPEVGLLCGGRRSITEYEQDGGLVNWPALGAIASEQLTLEELAVNNRVVTSTVLLKKAAVGSVGGFDEQFRGPEDLDLWLRLARQVQIRIVKAPLAVYRTQLAGLSMDERKFLPQALAVLDKAFAAGGALEGVRELRKVAHANQYWNAAWMAHVRGSRTRAVCLWCCAFAFGGVGRGRLRRRWFSTLARYAVGGRGAK